MEATANNYEIIHTLNQGCSCITLRGRCNNQQHRCDIAWFHATNHLYHGFSELNCYTTSHFPFGCLTV